MATGSNVTQIGISTGDAVQQVLNLTPALQTLVNRYDELGAATVKLNARGRVTQLTFAEFDRQLNKVTRTFRVTKTGFTEIGQGATNTGTRMTNLAIRAAEAKQALTAAFQGPKVGSASTAEIGRFQAAIKSLTNEVKTGRATYAELDAIHRKATAGLVPLTALETEVAEKYAAMQNAANQFGNAATNAANRAARAALALTKQQARQQAELNKPIVAARRAADVQAAAAAAGAAFGPKLASATPAQVLKYNAALNVALGLLERGKVTSAQFNQALANAGAKTPIPGLTGDLSRLQAALFKTGAVFDSTGGTGVKAGQKIFVTWQNVVRMVQSQVLYAGIGKLQQGFAEAATGAADYSQKVALIRTISQDANLSSGQWAAGIRRVSDELNSPLIDSAIASYDLLSNQITRGADTMGVLRTALEFGRTTDASAQDSVNLLSSAINSFHLGAGGAERAARTFFATIDLGRVTASELANSFGRTGTLAETLGVTLEETQAAISSMTRQGIKGNEAYTLLNNVFLKLIKPTEELQGFLKKIGYETGQDAVQAIGFTEVLSLLDREFDGNTATVARYFDELRGARGALNLTGKGLKEFKGDLEAITKSGDKYDVAKKIVGEAEGTKLRAELNKIKNYFIQDFGAGFLRTVVRISDGMGGLSKAVKLAVNAVVALGAATLAAYATVKAPAVLAFYATFADRIVAAIAAVRALTVAAAAMNVVLGVGAVAAIGATAGALIALGYHLLHTREAAAKAAKEIEEDFRAAANKLVEAGRESDDKRFQSVQDSLGRSRAAFLAYFAEIRVGYTKVADQLQAAQEKFVSSLDSTFDTLRGVLNKGVSVREEAAKAANAQVEKAAQARVEALRSVDADKFDRKFADAKAEGDVAKEEKLVQLRVKKLALALEETNDVEEANRLYQEQRRILALITEGRRKNAKIPTIVPSGHHNERRKVLGHDGTYRVQNYKTVDRDGGTSPFVTQATAGRAVENLARRYLHVLEDIAKVNAEVAETEAKKAANAKTAAEELDKQFKRLKDFTIYDSKGGVKEEYQGAAGRAQALREFTALQKGVTDRATAAGATLPDQIHLMVAFSDQFAQLRKQFSEQGKLVDAQVDNAAKQEALGKAEDKLKAQVTELTTAQTILRKEVIAGTTALNEQQVAARTLAKLLPDAGGGFLGFGRVGGLFGVKPLLDALQEHAATLQTNPQSAGQLGVFAGALKDHLAARDRRNGSNILGAVAREADPDVIGSKAVTVGEALDELKKQAEEFTNTRFRLQITIDDETAVQAGIQAVENQVGLVNKNLKDTQGAAKGAGEALRTGFEGAQDAVVKFRGTLIDALNTVNQIKLAQPGNAPSPIVLPPRAKARGGPVGYYSDGGFLADFAAGRFARGVDRVPIMAARGEYVVNARQTRQFLPLLRAINAGKLAPPSGTGGTTVGDINIAVKGGNTADQTIKGIADGLRRGLRTGAIRPF